MLEYDIEFLKKEIKRIAEKIGLTYEEAIEELQKRIEYKNKMKGY